MPNRHYATAANTERRIMKEWQKKGYRCIRSAGSHGVIDIICIRNYSFGTDKFKDTSNLGSCVVGIQHKKHSGLLKKEDEDELIRWRKDTNARVLVATPRPRKRPPFHYKEVYIPIGYKYNNTSM